MNGSVSGLVVAAGKGERMGGKLSKPYIELNGVPILALTLKKFNKIDEIKEIIVVTREEWLSYCRDMIKKYSIHKVKSIIKGGEKRQDSVRAGLDQVTCEFVAIHDGVRPFITPQFVSHLIKLCKNCGAVVPGIPVTSTIKEVRDGFVVTTLERDYLYEVQTPQIFSTHIIKRAHDEAFKANFYATDDAALVERLGIKVKLVEGVLCNIKITTKEDLFYAEKIIKIMG